MAAESSGNCEMDFSDSSYDEDVLSDNCSQTTSQDVSSIIPNVGTNPIPETLMSSIDSNKDPGSGAMSKNLKGNSRKPNNCESFLGFECDEDSLLLRQNSATPIPGTDSSMLSMLNQDNSFKSSRNRLNIESKKRKLNYSPSNNSRIIYNSQSPNFSAKTYGGFRDPDFFDSVSLSAHTPPSKPNKDLVVIVEPICDPNGSTHENDLRKFFSNDIALANNIKISTLGKHTIEKTTKNLRKNLLIVNLKLDEGKHMEDILKINKLGSYDVKCRLPYSEQQVRGVIGPIGLETPTSDIKNELLKRHSNLTDVFRINRGKEKIPSLSVRLTFKGRDLPNEVFIGHQKFDVRTYVGIPWRCFNCQGFGHNADVCRAKSRCDTCAEAHKSKDCPQKLLPTTEKKMKCANCNGSHTTSYGGCENIKTAKKVEKFRAHQGMNYRDAVLAVKGNSNPITEQRRSSVYEIPTKPKMKSIGIQVEMNNDSETVQMGNELNDSILTKLAVLMIKLVKMKNLSDSEAVMDTVEQVMGIKIPPMMLETEQPPAKENIPNTGNITRSIMTEKAKTQEEIQLNRGVNISGNVDKDKGEEYQINKKQNTKTNVSKTPLSFISPIIGKKKKNETIQKLKSTRSSITRTQLRKQLTNQNV